MARIRTIKPDFWMDARLAADLTRDQRLFYIGLWNQADDEGRFRAHPDLLKGALFPYDSDIQGGFIEDSLMALVSSRRLQTYVVEGERYAFLTHFAKHQVINRPSPSKLPTPPTTYDIITEDSLNNHGVLSTSRARAGRGRGRGKGKGKGKGSTPDVQPSGGGKPPSAHQAWMDRAVPAWTDLCPEDANPGGFLARAKTEYGPEPVQLAIEHMWTVGWNPNGEVKGVADKVKAFRSYLSKAAQGIRSDKEAKG